MPLRQNASVAIADVATGRFTRAQTAIVAPMERWRRKVAARATVGPASHSTRVAMRASIPNRKRTNAEHEVGLTHTAIDPAFTPSTPTMAGRQSDTAAGRRSPTPSEWAHPSRYAQPLVFASESTTRPRIDVVSRSVSGVGTRASCTGCARRTSRTGCARRTSRTGCACRTRRATTARRARRTARTAATRAAARATTARRASSTTTTSGRPASAPATSVVVRAIVAACRGGRDAQHTDQYQTPMIKTDTCHRGVIYTDRSQCKIFLPG
jgi:hypothetical protein